MNKKKEKETDINKNASGKSGHRLAKLLAPLAAVIGAAALLTVPKKQKNKEPEPKMPEEQKPAVREAEAVKPSQTEAVKTKTRNWTAAALMTAVLVYYELLLHQAGGFPSEAAAMIPILLFSMCYGILIYLLTSFSRKPNVNRFFRALILTVTAVVFLICFFVHKQFKVFYDINTMTAGASDAVGQFQSNIREMIFSADGMSRIILYFLPVIVYAFFQWHCDPAIKLSLKKKLTALAAAAVMFISGLGSAYAFAWGTYTTEYNFQNAIGSFGLLSALRLDVRKNIMSEYGFGFEITRTKLIHTLDGSGTEKLMWNKNEMDFDWAALAKTANSTQKNLDNYVASLRASEKNEFTGLFEGKNLIMIAAEAFSGDIIDEELTPTLYRLANKGIRFTDFYQPASAGTTGGEYEILFGMLPTNGGSSLKNTGTYNNYMTMGSQLNRLGYEGWAFHNNTYTFYDRHITHNNLGYSHGYMGYGSGMEQYVKWQWPQSDLEMIQGTLPLYENAEKFNVYYMSVSGHNGYTLGGNAMTAKNWDRVKDLPYSDRVKGYIAANLELEDALTYLVNRLEELGIADDTVIVICGDHFPYGLDDGAGLGQMPYLSELYGYQVNSYLERDHNRLILWSGCLEDMDPITVDTPTSSLDILPTLSNLFGTEFDSRLFPGRDVFSDADPLVFTIFYDWKTELGTYNSITGKFTPAEGAVIPEGYEEKIKKIVRNKITYCQGYNNTDYFNHLFGNN